MQIIHNIRGMKNPNNACYGNSAFKCLINIKCIKDSILNDPTSNILKAQFINYTNPLMMRTNINISDLRSILFENKEQQDSGDFLRCLLN